MALAVGIDRVTLACVARGPRHVRLRRWAAERNARASHGGSLTSVMVATLLLLTISLRVARRPAAIPYGSVCHVWPAESMRVLS